MHILTDLLAREGALLAVLLALGAAPASYLSRRFDAAGCLALAPILGFCVGVCVTTTLVEFTPANNTYWLLPVLAVLSVAVAVRRTLRDCGHEDARSGLTLRDVAQIVLVAVAVTGPLTYTLHSQHTVGPAAYFYTDVNNYVGEQDGAQTTSLMDARHAWENSLKTGSRFADLTQWDWAFLTSFNGNLNASPLDANMNALLGLGGTDTDAAFMIVILLAGALGVFATVRYATQSATWMAALAGALFGGPLFLELWFDTFQAAIIALGLVMPFAVLGWEALRARTFSSLVLVALVLATFLTVYPLFVPILVLTSGLVLAAVAVGIRRKGGSLRPLTRSASLSILAVAGLAILFDLVGFTRNVAYYRKLLNNEVPFPHVSWHLPIEILPGWLLQTREFWYLPSLGTGGFKQLALGLLLPLILLGFIALGIRRYRPALALVALAGVCALVAEYAYASNNACTYCAERDLLPLAPIAIVLVTLGLATALAMPQRWARALGLLGVALVVVAVGQRARVELRRFTNGSYFLDSANRSLLKRVPAKARAIELEGFGQTLSSQAEFALVYRLADERARGRVSTILGSNLNNAIEYLDFGVVKFPGPEFNPYYDYVLTRFAGIETDRRTIARSGGIALEQRTNPLDITPYAGLEAPLARLDPAGAAWVQPQTALEFYIAGSTPGPVWAKLTITGAEPVTSVPQRGLRARERGSTLTVCVPAGGSAPVRSASVQFSALPVPGTVPLEQFAPAVPLEGLRLTTMRALTGHCTP